MIAPLLGYTSKQIILWSTLGVLGAIGMVAILSPKCFEALASRGGRWVDTNKLAEVLDRRVDIDRYVLPFSRLLGAAVIASVAVLAYVVLRYE
jgi:hypothetical protein